VSKKLDYSKTTRKSGFLEFMLLLGRKIYTGEPDMPEDFGDGEHGMHDNKLGFAPEDNEAGAEHESGRLESLTALEGTLQTAAQQAEEGQFDLAGLEHALQGVDVSKLGEWERKLVAEIRRDLVRLLQNQQKLARGEVYGENKEWDGFMAAVASAYGAAAEGAGQGSFSLGQTAENLKAIVHQLAPEDFKEEGDEGDIADAMEQEVARLLNGKMRYTSVLRGQLEAGE
jgi:hypothetical protein